MEKETNSATDWLNNNADHVGEKNRVIALEFTAKYLAYNSAAELLNSASAIAHYITFGNRRDHQDQKVVELINVKA